MTAEDAAPFLSVIVPVYDDQDGLNATLDSIACQDYPPDRVEVIVVDNGSPQPIRVNPTLKVPTLVLHCKKPGSYAARNFGVARARGQVLAFIDADCVADPNWLKNGAAEAVHRDRPIGGEVLLFARRQRQNLVEKYQLATGFYQRQNIEKQQFSVTANLFVPRRIFFEIGPFNEALLSGGDREWGWRASAAGYPVLFAPHAIVSHPCRSTLGGAIRQVRRVTGGRYLLARQKDVRPFHALLGPHHGARDACRRLLQRRPGLGGYGLVAFGTLLWTVRLMEGLRLRIGGRPIR